jgi:hypothetical protein
MTLFASGPFWIDYPFLFPDAVRRCLAMRGTRGCFERSFQLADAFVFRYELLAQKSNFATEMLGLLQEFLDSLDLLQGALQELRRILACPLSEDPCGDGLLHAQSCWRKSATSE